MADNKENGSRKSALATPCKTPKKQQSASSEEVDSDESSVELTIDEAGPVKRRRRRIKTTEATKQFASEGLEGFEDEIERQLGTKAKKSQLSINNVKNILKHVITNHHVLAMVRKSMRDGGEEDGLSSEGENCPFEPKLTRAKTKEMLMAQTPIPWPVTPAKVPPGSATKKLIDQVHEDSSDDEEYQPNEEETENSDDECNSSLASDFEQVLTPTPSTPRSIADCSTQTTWTEDGVFKMPNTNFELMETMGMRTRSKVSLTDIPLEDIEQSFIPPDITTDMYEMECDNEDWKQFLNEFVQPLNKITEGQDDEEADPEYNILEDEEAEDQEEMRADRAVKVSKKELNELISELMDYMEPSDDENDADTSVANTTSQLNESSTSTVPSAVAPPLVPSVPSSPQLLQVVTHNQSPKQAHFLRPATPPEILPVAPSPSPLKVLQEAELPINSPPDAQWVITEEEEVMPIFTKDQRLLLNQQMMQHVQLLTQSYMQSCLYPEYLNCGIEMKENLFALKYLGGTSPASGFYAQNLNLSISVVEEWDAIVHKEENQAELKEFYEDEVERREFARKKHFTYSPHLNGTFMKVVSRSNAFIYPTLLPHCGLRPYFGVLRDNCFLPPEDNLIALGLEQYVFHFGTKSGSEEAKNFTSRDVWKYLAQYLLPVKSESAIKNRIKMVKHTLPENPIAQYYQTNQAPFLIHRVFPVKFITPSQQDIELLPAVWRAYIHGDFGL